MGVCIYNFDQNRQESIGIEKQKLNPYFQMANSFETLNPFVSINGENYGNKNESQVTDNLVREHIKMFGVKCKYILRTNNNFDEIFAEAAGANFSHSFDIALYPESTEGTSGRDSIMMFGYAMTDTVTLQASFSEMVEKISALKIEDRNYPLVGDLIVFNIPGQIYEVKYVEDKNVFWAQGKQTVYNLYCQIFDLGTETFSTGDEEIDILNNHNEMYEEPFMDNDHIQTEADSYVRDDEPNAWGNLLGGMVVRK